MTSTMDDYDLFGACQNVVEFVETLSNWYIRRSRDRFWAGDQDAIDTLHTALVTLCRVAAPLLPTGDRARLHRPRRDERSVHLTDWPDVEQFPHDDDLTTGMGQVRDVCSTLLSLRKSEGLRVRLPLAKAIVATPTTELMRPHLDILRDELNVKEIELTDDVQSVGRMELNLNPARLGPRLGGDTQQVIKAHKAGDWRIDGDRRRGRRRRVAARRVHVPARVVVRRRRGDASRQPRDRRARHRRHRRPRGGRARPRSDPRRSTGAPQRRPRRQRPDQPRPRGSGRRGRCLRGPP